jgi:hypothetical protein
VRTVIVSTIMLTDHVVMQSIKLTRVSVIVERNANQGSSSNNIPAGPVGLLFVSVTMSNAGKIWHTDLRGCLRPTDMSGFGSSVAGTEVWTEHQALSAPQRILSVHVVLNLLGALI